MRGQSRTVEEKVAAIAGRAQGVVTRAELLGAGLSSTGVERWLRKGLLIRRHPGVYRVGHAAPSIDASFVAAVKACGEEATLSELAAAYHLSLIKKPPPRPEVTTPTERRVKGVKTRRRRLGPKQVTKVRGIPVTTVPQTLVDIAAVLTEEELARACHEAGVRYKTTPRQVEAVLPRNAPGSRKLRAVMRGDVHVTLSELERGFLRLLREAGLPLPVTNKIAGSKRVDRRWPEQKLTVELVSYRFHNSYHSWEQDHARRREARARGDEFRTYTWRDITENAESVMRDFAPISTAGR
jgi:putative AbiEi antitoxin of type IV toxin-antitoxin system